MTVNNSKSMSGMFFYLIQIDMFICSIKFIFYNIFIESFDY